jgi:peptide/nickel transport system ATP-binding protein
MPEVLLSVEDLYVQFRTYAGMVHAVNGISFEIMKGETYGLVGETGCGKSVTGLALLRLIPQPGEVKAKSIRLGETNLPSLAESEMRDIRGKRISMIFQDPAASLNPTFTIGDQIVDIIRFHYRLSAQKARQRAEDTLSDMGLPSPGKILKMYPFELSGGMQQRVMIAMALSSGAELLIADEPTTALDVTIQAQILALLNDLRSRHGLSILLITHNLGVVAQSCDRVGVLYAGNLVEQGNTMDVFTNMKHPYTQALLAAVPQPDKRGHVLMDIPGSVPSGLNPLPGCSFHPRCPHVMEICREKKPVLLPVSDTHRVACFLHQPIAHGASL